MARERIPLGKYFDAFIIYKKCGWKKKKKRKACFECLENPIVGQCTLSTERGVVSMPMKGPGKA
mgnify:CR=1 FL=1